MKRIVVSVCFVLCLSCKNEDFVKVDAGIIAKNELQTIDLREVDSYPMFKSCDEMSSKMAQQSCFAKELHKWLKPYLDTLSVNFVNPDTIQLYLSVDEKGKLVQDSIQLKQNALKDSFQDAFNHPPQLYPAQKRGVPVKVSFQMPIIITPN